MRKLALKTMMIFVGVALAAGAADASEILVTQDLATSTTWTADNTYNLQDQIYVLPGATLTIEAGTVVASTTGLGGSLAVTKGAQIFVMGTQANPVIMTSKADVATWDPDPSHPTGGDPKTGSWREGVNEWGNLTIMGEGYISEDATPGNVPYPDPNNEASMEGLVAAFPGDPNVMYGGGIDDDDSGTINYLSLRYGGKVIALNNELNGMSMGGIGRETDVDHVEIMNNVDDGIETWGGTVNYRHISVWNIGDDSFDIDQGWRGKAEHILIVQGYSADADQGSGVGDNCFETDGAEDSDWQPVTSAVIYNATVVGQPIDGDGGTAWRDNARIQYRNCIFMDLGEYLVRFDNLDGDGAHGYGFNGTLSWPDTWTTAWNGAPPHANDPQNHGIPWADIYQAQSNGKLAEIKDSVFFRNLHTDAYTEATARGVFDPANNNVLIPGSDDNDAPIKTVTRGALVTKGGKKMVPVIYLDPRPMNEALTSVAMAPDDGFFTPYQYRGAFADGENWLYDWTASQAFGFTPAESDTLWTNTETLPESGGSVQFFLNAGAENGNREYLMVGGVSGTVPGIPLPGGAATLSVNYDSFTGLVISLLNTPIFDHFTGTLDDQGLAEATFLVPAPVTGVTGLKIYFAYACNKPWDFASNPVEVEIVP